MQYDARGFLEKNRDYLAPEIIQTFRSSRVPLISSLFHFALSKTGTIQPADHQRLPSATMESNQSFDLNPILTPLNASHNRVQATVSTYFRYSLTDLFSKMIRGSPKFVRCFKPNNDRVAGCFDAQTVLEQLKYSGILAGKDDRAEIDVRRLLVASSCTDPSVRVFASDSFCELHSTLLHSGLSSDDGSPVDSRDVRSDSTQVEHAELDDG